MQLGDFEIAVPDLIYKEGHQVASCKLSKQTDGLVKKNLTHGVVYFSLLHLCEKETLKEFLSQKKISDAEFYAFLIGFGVSTGTTAFQNFSANASLLLGGGGLIADLYHYKSNGWQIPLPGDDQLLAVIGNASAEAFLRNFVSGSKDTTRGRFYHQVNKRSRATLLSKYGQYERALIDLFKGLDELEPDLKNGDQLSRAIALSNILRVKVLLRYCTFQTN